MLPNPINPSVSGILDFLQSVFVRSESLSMDARHDKYDSFPVSADASADEGRRASVI
jgi:hypothetical protein